MGAGRLPGSAMRWKLKESSARAEGGLRRRERWSAGRRPLDGGARGESSSAGFWRACRSSVTEITGSRTRMTTTRATNCVRRLKHSHGAWRIHSQNISVASSAQTRLRIISIQSNYIADCVSNLTVLRSVMSLPYINIEQLPAAPMFSQCPFSSSLSASVRDCSSETGLWAGSSCSLCVRIPHHVSPRCSIGATSMGGRDQPSSG